MTVKELKEVLIDIGDEQDVFVVDISIPVTDNAEGTHDIEHIKDIPSLNALAIIIRSGGCGCPKCQELAKKN